MKYRYLLFDADQTLLDFDAAQHRALKIVFNKYHFPQTKELYSFYDETNKMLWRKLERREITKQELISVRFYIVCEKFRIPHPEGMELEYDYQTELANGHQVMPDALEICETLSKRYDLYLLTNGVEKTQEKRMRESGLRPFFKNTFVSETIGVVKPDEAYFQFVYEQLNRPEKAKMLMIGDSLASDIAGGNRFGIDTCHITSKTVEYDSIVPNYTIHSLKELFSILK